MKKVIQFVVLAICAFLVINFSFPVKVMAEEKSLADLKRQVIINLCNTNALLADKLNQQLNNGQDNAGVINVFFDRQGRSIEIVPTGNFFLQIKDLAERGWDIKYDEIINELLRHNILLEESLKDGKFQYFSAERVP